MIPPRNFPSGSLQLVEFREGKPYKTHAELPSNTSNRVKIQQMRNDLLMVDSKLDLQIRENNV